MAMSYVYTGPVTPSAIPGYSILLTLGILSMSTVGLVVIYLKKTKKYRE